MQKAILSKRFNQWGSKHLTRIYGGIRMSMQQVLEELIKDTIAPLLKAEGFKKRGKNFAKLLPDLAWTLNIQSSMWNTKDEVEFTLNTGIFTEKLFGTMYEFEAPQFPSEISSVLRLRINELKGTKDDWYNLDEKTDIQELKNIITRDIQETILPHFNKFQSLTDLIAELEKWPENEMPGSPHELTILYYNTGKEELALERLKNFISNCKLDSKKKYAMELLEWLELASNIK